MLEMTILEGAIVIPRKQENPTKSCGPCHTHLHLEWKTLLMHLYSTNQSGIIEKII